MSSAWSVTAAVNPPRAVFLDYPLGHTAGPPDDRGKQLSIMRDTLRVFESAAPSGEIVPLDYRWPTDWKRVERAVRAAAPQRSVEPQYQHEDDRRAAIERFGTEIATSPLASNEVPRD